MKKNIGDIMFVEDFKMEYLRLTGYWAGTYGECLIGRAMVWAQTKEEAKDIFDDHFEYLNAHIVPRENCTDEKFIHSEFPYPADEEDYNDYSILILQDVKQY